MSLKLRNIKFDYNTGNLLLSGDAQIGDTPQILFLCSIQRISSVKQCLSIPKKIYHKVDIKDKYFNCEIDLNNQIDLFMRDYVWDMYIYNKTKEEFTKIDIDFDFDTQYFDCSKHAIKIKPFKTINNKLAIYIKPYFSSIDCKLISGDKLGTIHLDLEKFNKYNMKNNGIRLKKRINPNILYYSKNFTIKLDSSTIDLDKIDFSKFELSHGDVIDLFYVSNLGLDYEKEHKINCETLTRDYCNVDEIIKGKLYTTDSKFLALYFNTNNIIKLNEICLEKNNFLNLKLEYKDDLKIKEINIIDTESVNYIKARIQLKDYIVDYKTKNIKINLAEIDNLLNNSLC